MWSFVSSQKKRVRILWFLAVAFFGTDRSAGETKCSSTSSSLSNPTPPSIRGRTLMDGRVSFDTIETTQDVLGCCSMSDDGMYRRVPIGTMPQFTSEEALRVLASARRAWNGGSGVWPQMSMKERIEAVSCYIEELKTRREAIVEALQWEIGKNRKDAESEFDRTIRFVELSIDAILDPSNGDFRPEFVANGSTRSFIRRAAIGIILCLGPFNYPLNETYATLIPALLMGNVVIMKIPTTGGLAHLLTMEPFAKCFPAGAIQLISGSGRTTMPPLMETGEIDGLAFIGGLNAADDLISKHPSPHRLKLFLQLEAKNMAVFLPDMFDPQNSEQLDAALDQAVIGSLSYNGQRCTALKLFFVPKRFAESFAKALASKVESLRVGLPWHDGPSSSESQITPLVNAGRVSHMKRLISDAVSKGATVMNVDGGSIIGGEDSTLMVPAVMFPVDVSMELYSEEQFGPVVPVAEYEDLETVLKYARESKFGQQVSIFTTQGEEDATSLVDKFSTVFGKININSQCARSPDTIPFSGRRSSAMGVMSVIDALREFSIPTVISYKMDGVSEKVVDNIRKASKFMNDVF